MIGSVAASVVVAASEVGLVGIRWAAACSGLGYSHKGRYAGPGRPTKGGAGNAPCGRPDQPGSRASSRPRSGLATSTRPSPRPTTDAGALRGSASSGAKSPASNFLDTSALRLVARQPGVSQLTSLRRN